LTVNGRCAVLKVSVRQKAGDLETKTDIKTIKYFPSLLLLQCSFNSLRVYYDKKFRFFYCYH